MANNEILKFCETDTGTNLLSQAEYEVDSQREIGNQAGIARSKFVNKVLKQTSLLSAGLAQFLADNQGDDITDELTEAEIASYLESVVGALGVPVAVAGGTADAITADFTPDLSLDNGRAVIVRAGAANTTTTPTFAPDGTAAKAIVKGNGIALVAGDIAGAGHWLLLSLDTTQNKWVLGNPAHGISVAADLALKQDTLVSGTNIKTINSTSLLGSGNVTISGLGEGQTWQDVTASRGSNVTYTNTTGRPISVFFGGTSAHTSYALYVNINGNGDVKTDGDSDAGLNPGGGGAGASFVVPNGNTYLVKWGYLNSIKWLELR